MLIVALVALPVQAQERGEAVFSIPEVPALSVTLSPDDAATRGVHVQEQLVLRVQVASRRPFEALDLQLPKIAGATIVELAPPRSRIVRSYVGEGHVLETTLAVFPDRSGRLVIPAVQASGYVRIDGERVTFDLAGPEWDLPVAGIEPDLAEGWWVVSSHIQMGEAWSIPLADLREGDIVERTVVLTAFGVTADRMPHPEHGRTRGIAVGTAREEIRTERTDKGLASTLTQVWTLKVERGGVVYIAPIGVPYWDPVSGEARKAALPGHRIEPLPPDEAAIARRLIAQAESDHRRYWGVAIALGAVLLAPLLFVVGLVIWTVLPTGHDRALTGLCRDPAVTPTEVYRAIQRWEGASPLEGRACRALLRAVFGTGTPPRATDVAVEICNLARRERLRELRTLMLGFRDAIIGPLREL